MTFEIGDSFWVRTPFEPVEHIWIIITKPNPLNRTAIWVNLTTERPDSDRTTVVRRGDHPTVCHTCVVYYRDAKFVDLAKLEVTIDASKAKRTGPCPNALLLKIQDGLLVSRFTAKNFSEPLRQKKLQDARCTDLSSCQASPSYNSCHRFSLYDGL
jgi:hypothetical protein